MIAPGLLLKRAAPFAIAIGIWFAPGAGRPHGARRGTCSRSSSRRSRRVLLGAFPLLTASMIAVGTVVLTGTITPAQAFSGFANSSVLLVVIAFIVAQAVVKSGLGRRISLFMVSRFGGSSLGLAYSIVLTDAAIAPAFPSNTARGGVLFPIVLSVAKGAGSNPEDPEGRRLGGYLMFCAMASLAVSSALWMTATSANPIGVQIAQKVRARDRLRILAPRLLRARARRDRDVAPARREALSAPRRGDARSSRSGTRGARRHGADVAGRVDHGGDLRGDGRRLGVRRRAEAQRDQHRVHGVRRAAGGGRAHARRHRQAGRHAGDLPLARGPFRPERPAERARLHGLCGRAPGLAPGRPVVAGRCTSP